MKIHASVTDFPLFAQTETFFKQFKEAGVEGLELVVGAKSRFEYARLSYLSEKYDLPIGSLHQPPWSGIGLYFDEDFLQVAKRLGVKNIVFHPLAFRSFESHAMQKYFEKLAFIKDKWDVTILIENMPKDIVYEKLHDNTPAHMQHHLEKMKATADTYGFLLTYDVSHAEFSDPQKLPIFQRLLPSIGVIHVSSFSKDKHHLSLLEGDFHAEPFFSYLVKKKYQGQLVLEINRSLFRRILYRYNFKAVKDSVALIKKTLDK